MNIINDIEIVTIPKKLREITNLYRMCKFKEADKRLAQFEDFPHHKAAIKAQLVFFKGKFEKTVEYILEYFPYLGEWYSGNIIDETIYMLEYSFTQCNDEIKKNAVNYIEKIYKSLSDEQKNSKSFSQFKFLPELSRTLEGVFENSLLDRYGKKYSKPENPRTLDEIINEFCTKFKIPTEIPNFMDLLIDSSFLENLFIMIENNGYPEDYVFIYEKLKKSKKLSMYCLLNIVQAYLYLGEYEKAKETVIDIVKYKWLPVEYTDIMPISALRSLDFHNLYSKEFFDILFNIPKGVEIKYIQETNTLKSKANFDEIFKLNEFEGYKLKKKIISKLNITSGKIIVADPLVYLCKDTLPYMQKVPNGEYDVEALIAIDDENRPMIAVVKVDFGIGPTVEYKNALFGNETQAEIDELENGDYIGFPVDSGLATIIDTKAKNEFLKFQKKWHKENEGQNFYSSYFAELFKMSYREDPEHQRDCGDYINFNIPNTIYHFPIFASGAGDGYYPVYMGYNEKNKVSSVVIEFLEVY